MLTTILRGRMLFRRTYASSLGAALLVVCLCRTVGAQDGLQQCAATTPSQGQPAAPTFTAAANTAQYCPGAQSGYTCDPHILVTGYSPSANACYAANGDTHCEYCVSQMVRSDGNLDCKFHHGAPTHFTINASGNAMYTVCSQYKVADSSPVYSAIGAATITLNQTIPTAALNSPAGILVNDTLSQTQYLNSTVGQWITYWEAAAPGGEPLLGPTTPPGPAQAANCPTPTCPTPPATYTVLPFVYETSNELQWTTPIASYSSVSVVATDEAGNQFGVNPKSETAS